MRGRYDVFNQGGVLFCLSPKAEDGPRPTEFNVVLSDSMVKPLIDAVEITTHRSGPHEQSVKWNLIEDEVRSNPILQIEKFKHDICEITEEGDHKAILSRVIGQKREMLASFTAVVLCAGHLSPQVRTELVTTAIGAVQPAELPWIAAGIVGAGATKARDVSALVMSQVDSRRLFSPPAFNGLAKSMQQRIQAYVPVSRESLP